MEIKSKTGNQIQTQYQQVPTNLSLLGKSSAHENTKLFTQVQY